MDIYDQKKREAQKKKNIYASLMIFLDQKTAKRNIQENFWFIDGHLWPKGKNIHASLWLKTATKTIHKRVGVFVFSYSKTRTSLQKYNFSFIRYNFKGRKFYDSSFFCWIV